MSVWALKIANEMMQMMQFFIHVVVEEEEALFSQES